jgi:hypothetical protein
MKLRSLLLFASLSVAAPLALAHDEHCHRAEPDGKLADLPEIKTKAACKDVNGIWEHHHSHCHKNTADGGHVDIKAARNEKECKDKGGMWTDHGHDTNKK